MISLLLLLGCRADDCEVLCERTAGGIDVCLADWPAQWSDLDASSARQFERFCDNQWREVRGDLEPRELDDALDQCQESTDALTALQTDGESCDVLRALYLE